MYPAITGIALKNFMSFDEAALSFDDSNILNLKGYNDSGKSTVIRAFEICLMNRYKTKQAGYIRDGESFFRIVVFFEDGVKILREKYGNGQSLYEMYKDDDLVFTTKQGTQNGKVEDVPQPLKDYLGLTQMGDSYLNTRSNMEPQWLVETTGSENFQSVSDVLKAEELYRSLQMVKKDIRGGMDDATNLRATLTAYEEELLTLPSKDLLKALERGIQTSESDNRSLSLRRRQALNIASESSSLLGYAIPPEVQPLDGDRLKSIESITRALALLGEEVPPAVEPVPLPEQLRLLTSVSSAFSELGETAISPEVPALPSLDRVKASVSLYRAAAQWAQTEQEVAELEKELDALRSEFHEALHELNADTLICSHCGELNLVGAKS